MMKISKSSVSTFSSSINRKILSMQTKSFLSGTNSRYLEKMHEAWRKDPNSVHISWKTYFENLEKGLGENSFTVPPTFSPNLAIKTTSNTIKSTEGSGLEIDDSVKISQLIRVYQKQGYLKATFDPLKLVDQSSRFEIYKNIKDLGHQRNGFTDADLEKEYRINVTGIKSGIQSQSQSIKLKDLISKLEYAYCGDIGVEFKHIANREEVNFIIDSLENKWVNFKLSEQEKIDTYKRLAWATKLESFLDVKFMTKRFGLEGLETMITGISTFFELSSKLGVKDITLGMAHRGRLNVLANCFGKPIIKIFKEMMGKQKNIEEKESYSHTGDVKYHLGASQTIKMKNGRQLTMEILCNPSHLECVNPVVQGKVRAKQHFNKDEKREE